MLFSNESQCMKGISIPLNTTKKKILIIINSNNRENASLTSSTLYNVLQLNNQCVVSVDRLQLHNDIYT